MIKMLYVRLLNHGVAPLLLVIEQYMVNKYIGILLNNSKAK